MSLDIANYMRGSQSMQGGLEGYQQKTRDYTSLARGEAENTYKDAIALAKEKFDQIEDKGRMIEGLSTGALGIYEVGKGIYKGVKKFKNKMKNIRKQKSDPEDDGLEDETNEETNETLNEDTTETGDLTELPSTEGGLEEVTEPVINNLTEEGENFFNGLSNKVSSFGQDTMKNLFNGKGEQVNSTASENVTESEWSEGNFGERVNVSKPGEGIEMKDMSKQNEVKEGTNEPQDQVDNTTEGTNETETDTGLGNDVDNAVDETTEAVTDATEVGTDVAVETGIEAASMGVEAIPIVGQILGAIGIAVSTGMSIYDAVKGAKDESSADDKAQQVKQNTLDSIRASTIGRANESGTFSTPVMNAMQNFE